MILDGAIDLAALRTALECDLVIVACGYESRARYFVERRLMLGKRQVALAFGTQRELAFDRNVRVFRERGVDIVDVDEEKLSRWMRASIEEAAQGVDARPVRVFIDVSSQSRSRMARILEGVVDIGRRVPLEVFFAYALAEFDQPDGKPAPIRDIGPVSPRFAGWTLDPELPTSLIVGLGYEQDRAMGAVEFLEPAGVWALLPRSSISAYSSALQRANRAFLRDVKSRQQLLYSVEDPNATFALLNSLVLHLAGRTNVILLPSGPKILALLSLLTSLLHNGVGVWRVSAGANERPIDRKASGTTVVVRARFRPLTIVPSEVEMSDAPDAWLGVSGLTCGSF
jgi:hypothetical protein